jgi:SAM-dependent methyltransferase
MKPYKLEQLILKNIKGFARFLFDKIPMKIEIRWRRTKYPGEVDRFSYQMRYINFEIKSDDRVLDVGSGGYPFPYATVLVDRFLEASRHRYEPLVRNGKPLIVADIHSLPFRDKCFDFVYCSHVLEHVNDPILACSELMRVGKRGFIETPTMGKDILFAWAKGRHKWHVVAIGQTLCFFEYSERQLDGIRSSAWRDLIFSKWYHPLQEAFYDNQDVFNVMFTWHDKFTVFVFRLDGTIDTLNAEARYCNAGPHPQRRLS